eukprot:scaffold763_cov403-Pavlova_lutheri.AAC.6
MYGALDDDTGHLSAHAGGLKSSKEFSTRPRTRKRNAHGYGGERAPNVIVPDCGLGSSRLLDLRPWSCLLHTLTLGDEDFVGERGLHPLSRGLLLPCIERASAGVGGANGRAGASTWCPLSRWSGSEEEACCALGLASRRSSVSQSREGPGVYLSHRLSLAVGIGATGVSWQPTCSLELHLTVRCVRRGANVSWQSHRHRPAPQPYLLEAKGRDGFDPLQSVCFGLNPRCPSQEIRSDSGRPSFNTTPQGDRLRSGIVQPLFEEGHHCPSSIWGLGGPLP